MSRIDDALKRVSGTPEDPRAASSLDRYEPESAAREDPKVASFVPTSPFLPESRSQASAAAPPELPPPAQVVIHEAATEAPIDREKLIDFPLLGHYAAFVAGSVRRHLFLAAAAFLLVIGLTAAALVVLPKTYHVETKLLAQRNAVMAALSNPGRAVPWDADAPTRAAAETVLRRDNLLELVRKTNLMQEWERNRPPVLRFKDRVMAALTQHEPTYEEKLDGILGLIEARMVVVAGPVGDGTVTIQLDWPNAQQAYALVQAAQQAFLDARQAADTAAINESISILERYSASLHEDINRTLAELERTRPKAALAARAAVASGRTRLPLVRSAEMPATTGTLDPLAASNTEQLNRTKTDIAAKRQEIARLEEIRQRQLTDAQAQLRQLMSVYTTTHPSVISAQQNIAALMHPAPQVAAMQAELKDLEDAYTKLANADADQQIKTELARRAAAVTEQIVHQPGQAPPLAETPAPPPGTTDLNEFATLRLRSELNQLESVLERTDGARIELAVSQAAFKYRYVVIRPAQVPRQPSKPNMRLVLAAGFIGAILFALMAVVVRDLMSDRILEAWQVERRLGIPVLGAPRMV